MDQTHALTVLSLSISAALAAGMAPTAWRRLTLSRAKHRSLTGHSRMAKRVAGWLPGYRLEEQAFLAPTVPIRRSKSSAAVRSKAFRCTSRHRFRRARR